jgi:hypothetical protein
VRPDFFLYFLIVTYFEFSLSGRLINNAPVSRGEPIFISGLLHKPIRNNMRSSWSSLFTILVLIAISISIACVLQPQENQTPVQNISPPVNVGPRQIPELPVPSSAISFDSARQMLGDIEPWGEIGRNNRQGICFFQGRNLDEMGNAESWLFGTQSLEGNQLQVYERNRWTTIPWNTKIPAEEIKFNNILLPQDLINQSRDEIRGTSGSGTIRVIELNNGIYSYRRKPQCYVQCDWTSDERKKRETDSGDG